MPPPTLLPPTAEHTMGAQESKAESIKYTTHSQDERLAFGTSCLQGWRPYMEDFHAAIPRLPNVTHSHYCPHPYVCIINPSKADAANGHPAAAAETEPKGISFSVSGGNTNKSKRPGAGQPTVHPSPYTFSGELFPAEEHYSFFGVYDGHRGNRVAHFISRRLHWKVAGEDSFREKNFPEAMRRGFISLDAELLQGGTGKISQDHSFFLTQMSFSLPNDAQGPGLRRFNGCSFARNQRVQTVLRQCWRLALRVGLQRQSHSDELRPQARVSW